MPAQESCLSILNCTNSAGRIVLTLLCLKVMTLSVSAATDLTNLFRYRRDGSIFYLFKLITELLASTNWEKLNVQMSTKVKVLY